MASVKDRTDTQLIVGRPAHFDDIRIGSSIAVSGVCLSIVDFSDAHMTFDVIDETWSRSNFVSLQEGDKVNLERAMKASDRLEGHIVQGHCEVSAEICNRSSDGIDVVLPEDLLPFVPSHSTAYRLPLQRSKEIFVPLPLFHSHLSALHLVYEEKGSV